MLQVAVNRLGDTAPQEQEHPVLSGVIQWETQLPWLLHQYSGVRKLQICILLIQSTLLSIFRASQMYLVNMVLRIPQKHTTLTLKTAAHPANIILTW